MTELHSASQKARRPPPAPPDGAEEQNHETRKGPDPDYRHPDQAATDQGPKDDDYGQQQVTIIVNAREKVWTEREISFDQVVKLAFPTPPPGANIVYTVTYRRGQGRKPEGTLTEGELVKVKDGMIFNVTATDKS